MKTILENWRHTALQEAVDCNKLVKKTSMRFEWVVVYRARQLSQAAPLEDAEYRCASEWQNEPYGKSKLGDLADKGIQLALDSGAISMADLKKADMQRLGRQVPTGGKRKIEIKTDIVFGDKTISVKLSGDVQGQSAEAFSTALQLHSIYEEVFEEWEKASDAAVDDTLEKYLPDLNSKIDGIRSQLKGVTDKMIAQGKQPRLTSTRVPNLIKIMSDPTHPDKAKAEQRFTKLFQNEIIDQAGKILKDEVDHQMWNETYGKELAEELSDVLDKDPAFRRNLTDEILTGRRQFIDNPGAIAQYMLSPEHFYVLNPSEEKLYEEAIDVFEKAMTLRLAAKSGRPLGGTTLGSKPAYRFDIKAAVLKRIEAAVAKAKQNI
mgnify:CR=1 FL=1